MAATRVDLDHVGSTNDWLATQLDGGPDELWVRADRQTSGRGRRGRVWVSVPGNLFASVLVRPQPGEGPAQLLSFVAAVALRQALEHWAPAASLRLKWPNDVLLGGTKVAGILLEGHAGATIIGIGVNLAGHPADLDRPATSIAGAGIPAPTAAEFLDVLVVAFAAVRAEWRRDGFAPIRRRWLAGAAGLGGRIEARLGSETICGRFEDIGGDGALILRLDDATVRRIHAGEVFPL
ncbi:MAG: biotin--[acetyl-CoA-carboxylase] ligase [Janthinobacterium lividum]